jgi:ABC-type nitrate/sulfonate/bicarbonate transport system substrate-binding protein
MPSWKVESPSAGRCSPARAIFRSSRQRRALRDPIGTAHSATAKQSCPSSSAAARLLSPRLCGVPRAKKAPKKERGTLEEKLKPLGYSVIWTEFPSGPPLLEALNVGSIDFGISGETPPIFAQAAGAPLVYLAYDPPAPQGEAILVPKDSPLKSVADLKGWMPG